MATQLLRYLSILCVGLIWSLPSIAADHFNILLYHHISSTTPRSTSLSAQEFEGHLKYLQENNYHVIDLAVAIDAVQKNQPLPNKSVVITFDDAWRDIYLQGVPLLNKYGYPFTVFVNTDPIDQKNRHAMTWDMLRDLKSQGVNLANHTRDHDYLVRKPRYDEQWLANTLANITYAQQRLTDELGPVPKWLAYPFGEYNNSLKNALKERGYIAFGQQSGGVAQFSDWQALPRFPAAGPYSNLKTLKTKLASQPFPANYAAFKNPVIRVDQGGNSQPLLGVELTTAQRLGVRQQLSCFIVGERETPVWQDKMHFTVSASKALGKGRNRYNCTAPIWGQKNYYWLSHQWLIYGGEAAPKE
ncbi:MAG: polysaccharide deacetylase family protein [Gammaproteobacteria bacterium]|nr:polysaccharide deacetylase family protein [Gammaproteobacteria bacterium]